MTNTGIILSELDPNGNGATYTYDNLLRLTKITPTDGEEVEYIYYPFESDGSVRRIEYGRGFDPSTGGTILEKAIHEKFYFDGFGRLIKNMELMEDGSYSLVEKFYDPDGREVFVSEPYKEGDSSITHSSLTYPGTPIGYSVNLPKRVDKVVSMGYFQRFFQMALAHHRFLAL